MTWQTVIRDLYLSFANVFMSHQWSPRYSAGDWVAWRHRDSNKETDSLANLLAMDNEQSLLFVTPRLRNRVKLQDVSLQCWSGGAHGHPPSSPTPPPATPKLGARADPSFRHAVRHVRIRSAPVHAPSLGQGLILSCYMLLVVACLVVWFSRFCLYVNFVIHVLGGVNVASSVFNFVCLCVRNCQCDSVCACLYVSMHSQGLMMHNSTRV